MQSGTPGRQKEMRRSKQRSRACHCRLLRGLCARGGLCLLLRRKCLDRALRHADVLDDIALCGADIGAAAALDAVHHAVAIARLLHILPLAEDGEHARHESHRTRLHATSAADAVELRPVRRDAAREREDAGRAFRDRHIEALLRAPHHRPAREHLVRLLREAAAERDGIAVARAETHAQVLRRADRIARDRPRL